MPVSVGFISLGCAKNLVDSQIMAGFLKQGQIQLASSPETADIILVNTCAFIDIAREEAAEAILSACAHKAQGGWRAVVVTGCLVQRYRDQLESVFPDVDAFIGVDELERIGEVVHQVAEGKQCGVLVAAGQPVKLYNPAYPTLLFTGGPFAYLKIAEGCDHRCAYCAIPNIRGSFRSRAADDLLLEAETMVRAGVREINLISQDSLLYGADQAGKPSIAALLRRIDTIDGDFLFRVLYGYPAGVTDEVLEVLNTAKHLCKYLDLPIQHSHPDILRAMHRGPAVAAIEDLAPRLRRAVPGVVLRTTCLVGFPGETEEHFQHLLKRKRPPLTCRILLILKKRRNVANNSWRCKNESWRNVSRRLREQRIVFCCSVMNGGDGLDASRDRLRVSMAKPACAAFRLARCRVNFCQ